MKALLFTTAKEARDWSAAELRKTGLPEGSKTLYLYDVREHEDGLAEVLIPEKEMTKLAKEVRDKLVTPLPVLSLSDLVEPVSRM